MWKDDVISDLRKLKHLGNLAYEYREDIYVEVSYCLKQNEDNLQKDTSFLLDELEETSSVYEKIFLYLHMQSRINNPVYVEKALDEVIASDELSVDEKYFVYSRIKAIFFSNPVFKTTDYYEDRLDDLYKQIVDYYLERVDLKQGYIPIENRNKDFVLVITGQMLMIQHGPTKTTLDRCKILIENMEKEVLLINTGTCLPNSPIVPVPSMLSGNYIDEYCDADAFNYEGVKIPYVQMQHRLPTVDEIKGLIQLVCEYKPYQIVVIGTAFAEEILCKLIDTIVISLAPSKMERTFVQYQQIGRPINDIDRRILKYRNLTEDHVISDVFTSHLAPQEGDKTRGELSLPEDAPIGVVVGGRLQSEITEEFINALKPAMENGMYLLVLGGIDALKSKFQEWLGKLYDQMIMPGMVSDPLAYLDHCFIYRNPYRDGGGTSSVEAMSKGVPVVTIRKGDVYTNTGEEFGVADYEEMKDKIIEYMENLEYHNRMSDVARKRAELMLDSSTAFMRVMNEFEKRMLLE